MGARTRDYRTLFTAFLLLLNILFMAIASDRLELSQLPYFIWGLLLFNFGAGLINALFLWKGFLKFFLAFTIFYLSCLMTLILVIKSLTSAQEQITISFILCGIVLTVWAAAGVCCKITLLILKKLSILKTGYAQVSK